MTVSEALAHELNHTLAALPWQERLNALLAYPGLHMAFSTSFSYEDQALTHLIARDRLPIRVFTLDTGRLFEATQATHQRTRERYGLVIETYYPNTQAIEAFVRERGINSIYESVENRLACCHIRKVEPLARALKGVDLWVSGVRREHSAARAQAPLAQWDAARNLIALYPLADVSGPDVIAFVNANDIPYNPLHAEGYPSIGCAPCTRAVAPGEDPRAGRWWWEQEEKKECGLHVRDGKLVRIENDTHAG